MTPKMESHLRHLKGTLLFVVALSCVLYAFWILDSRTENVLDEPVVVIEPQPEPAPPSDEWLYVSTNSVLLYPVVEDGCKIKYALMQVHKGTKVLVIARHGEYVEIEQDDQSALHTHGCIHESMLETR